MVHSKIYNERMWDSVEQLTEFNLYLIGGSLQNYLGAVLGRNRNRKGEKR
jgi:hypothetical protein